MIFSLFVFIFICLSCGALGGWATAKSVKTWYPALKKPRWNPPDKIFAPVWTTLYLIMAVSAWLVWEKGSQEWRSWPLVLFSLQLMLNAAWSVIFFGLRRPDWALAEVVVLWILILLTMLSFWKVYWLAGILFVPYLLWVSFAILLNAAIVIKNPPRMNKNPTA